MKLIFLDIDGVLNSNNWFKHCDEVLGKGQLTNNFCPEAIEELNHIVKTTEAKVVITSTWRVLQSKKELQKHFKEEGLNCEIIDTTPVLKTERGIEIQTWLDQTKLTIEAFVIIDDINDMPSLEEDLVLIDSNTGLTKDYRNLIKEKLKKRSSLIG